MMWVYFDMFQRCKGALVCGWWAGVACAMVLHVIRQLMCQSHHLQLCIDGLQGRLSSSCLSPDGVPAEAARWRRGVYRGRGYAQPCRRHQHAYNGPLVTQTAHRRRVRCASVTSLTRIYRCALAVVSVSFYIVSENRTMPSSSSLSAARSSTVIM